MPINANNLLWVKSIKHKDGTVWAYMDDEHQSEFLLDFSKHWQKGAAASKVGEVILLFQTTNMKGYRGTHLTHLVTPVTNQTVATDNPAFPRARLVRVIARASLPNPIKMPEDLIFFKPNRGGCCKLSLIERDNGGSRRNGDKIPLDKLQSTIWGLFEGHFRVS